MSTHRRFNLLLVGDGVAIAAVERVLLLMRHVSVRRASHGKRELFANIESADRIDVLAWIISARTPRHEFEKVVVDTRSAGYLGLIAIVANSPDLESFRAVTLFASMPSAHVLVDVNDVVTTVIHLLQDCKKAKHQIGRYSWRPYCSATRAWDALTECERQLVKSGKVPDKALETMIDALSCASNYVGHHHERRFHEELDQIRGASVAYSDLSSIVARGRRLLAEFAIPGNPEANQ